MLGLTIGELNSKPDTLGLATILFNADGLLADFAKMWDFLGNTHGGNLRCFNYTSSFSKEQLANTINYSVYRNAKRKGSVINFKIFFTDEGLNGNVEEERKKNCKRNGNNSTLFTTSYCFFFHEKYS